MPCYPRPTVGHRERRKRCSSCAVQNKFVSILYWHVFMKNGNDYVN